MAKFSTSLRRPQLLNLNVGACNPGDVIEYKVVVAAFSGYEIQSFAHTCKDARVYSVPVNTLHATVNGKVRINLTIKEVTSGSK